MGVRGYTSYPFQGFGKGLNLTDKPDAVDPAECIDALNVVFTDRGAITQRPGYEKLTSAELTNTAESLEPFYETSGTRQLIAGCGTRLEAISDAGEVIASETGLTEGIWGFTRFGKPNAEVVYAGNGHDTLRKWDGTEWTTPKATVNGEEEKAMPKAGSLCVWPEAGNRLVATRFETTSGGPEGKTSSPDHVYFSDPGDPESWTDQEGEENYVQLLPGNGEKIQACVAWREFVFVFKETSFFVFYGESVGSEGAPEFLFRPVEGGVGLASPRAIAVHPSGVYFMSRQGVYRTTGQEPELISSAIEPIWAGEASPFYTGGTLDHGNITNCVMTAHEDRIYLAYPTESVNDRTLIYDPQDEWWSITDIPAASLASFRVSDRAELVFGYSSGTKNIGRHAINLTSDDGIPIASHWRSGWFDLGSPDVKTIRSSKVWGTGTVEMALGYDFRRSSGTGDVLDFADAGSDTWGGTTWGGGEWAEPRGLIAQERRRATRGTTFSVYFSST